MPNGSRTHKQRESHARREKLFRFPQMHARELFWSKLSVRLSVNFSQLQLVSTITGSDPTKELTGRNAPLLIKIMKMELGFKMSSYTFLLTSEKYFLSNNNLNLSGQRIK